MAKLTRTRAAAGNPIAVIFVQDSSSTTGAGLTGLTNASSGLKISLRRELDAAPTGYSVAGATIETIAALGTYAAPTATKIRFKEVDATLQPGFYEVHVAQAMVGTGDASRFVGGLAFGATNMAPCPFEIQLDTNDPADVYVRIGAAGAGLTAVGLAGLDSPVLHAGTAQAGAAGSITLAAGASAVDSIYVGETIAIYAGTGAGQTRVITAYVGATKVATPGRNWVTAPDATSQYKVLAESVPKVDASLRVDVGSVAGTVQSAGDIPARLPAALAADGSIKASVESFLGSAFTEGAAGRIAAAFKKFFNIAAPAATMDHLILVDTVTTASNAPAAAAIRAEIDANSTQLAAILSAVGNLNNLSALANVFGPPVMEIPDAGTVLVPYTIVFRDSEGHLIDVDANAVTLTAFNAAGVDRSANWSAVTHASAGVYTANYSVAFNAAKEGLRIAATAAVGGSARRADAGAIVEDYDTVSMLAGIKAKTDNLPVDPASEANATTNKNALLARLGNPAAASVSADVAEVAADVDAIITAIGVLNDLSKADVRTALGMGAPDLDVQLDAIAAGSGLSALDVWAMAPVLSTEALRDEFARADNPAVPGATPAGQAWVVDQPSVGILGGALYFPHTFLSTSICHVDHGLTDNFEISITFKFAPAGNTFRAWHGSAGGLDGMELSLEPGDCWFSAGGTTIDMSALGIEAADGDTYTIRRAGPRVALYHNGALVDTLLMSTAASAAMTGSQLMFAALDASPYIERVVVSSLDWSTLSRAGADVLLGRHYRGGSDGTLGNRVTDILGYGLAIYVVDPITKVGTFYHLNGEVIGTRQMADDTSLGLIVNSAP